MNGNNKTTAIVVSIIALIGTITAALISNWDKIRNNLQSKVKEEKIQVLSFCNMIDILANDAVNNFKNSRLELIEKNEDEEVWTSRYQANGFIPIIEHSKSDGIAEVTILMFEPTTDSIFAFDAFDKSVVLLDGCLAVARKPIRNTFRSSTIDYEGKNFTVSLYGYVRMLSNSLKEFSLEVNIYKSGYD